MQIKGISAITLNLFLYFLYFSVFNIEESNEEALISDIIYFYYPKYLLIMRYLAFISSLD